MNRFSVTLAAATISAFALIVGAPVGAHAADDMAADVANSPLAAKADEAANWTKGAEPKFACIDPTDKTSCRITRSVVRPEGVFSTSDFSGGQHQRCFRPDERLYRVCREGEAAMGELANPRTHHWDNAPYSDARCNPYGNRLSEEYLACEAALPPLQ